MSIRARPRAGIGRALLAALIARCEQGDWRQMIAVIGDSANAASIGLHAELGFRHVGTLHAVGFKFGRWIDSVLMQRALQPAVGEACRKPAPESSAFAARLRALGPWRAVAVLGVTQILAWGAIFYTPVLMRAADRGGARLLVHLRDGRFFRRPARRRACCRRRSARLIDRHGGHRVMPFGSLAGAAGLVGAHAREPSARLCGGVDAARRRASRPRSTIRPSRRSAASSAPARAPADHGADARGRLRLDGELARDLRAARAARLEGHLSGLCRAARASSRRRCMPSRCRARAPTPMPCPPTARAPPPPVRPASGAAFLLLVAAFAAYAFIPSGLSAHLLAILQRAGIDAGTRRVDRHAVRPLAGRRAAVRVHLRAQHPSAADRALRRRRCWWLRSRCCALFGISTPTAVAVRDHVRRSPTG